MENALREFCVPYTILRPGYYIRNDFALKGTLMGPGIYSMPIGTAGICGAREPSPWRVSLWPPGLPITAVHAVTFL